MPRARACQGAALDPGPLDFNLTEIRRRTVRRALAHTGGHRAITARLLGISPNTLTKLVAEACPVIPPRSKPRRRTARERPG